MLALQQSQQDEEKQRLLLAVQSLQPPLASPARPAFLSPLAMPSAPPSTPNPPTPSPVRLPPTARTESHQENPSKSKMSLNQTFQAMPVASSSSSASSSSTSSFSSPLDEEDEEACMDDNTVKSSATKKRKDVSEEKDSGRNSQTHIMASPVTTKTAKLQAQSDVKSSPKPNNPFAKTMASPSPTPKPSLFSPNKKETPR
eukprot:TRINITY_DN9559_c0_g1_i1.p1 TRINITY_DN9559_c0_g1~~TRINITY_DN9559_c0_g1_i1.p1  ORF type:complete len:200 (+),score=52.85 TRINITY_DN9559_c0_g1_i1:39-638(+)